MTDEQQPELRRPRILVVEDDETLCTMVARMLSPLGEVRTAFDGIEALRMVRGDFTPELIVADIMMPGMDGLSLTKRLKADRSTARIPVVLLTAKDRPQDVIDGINSGARHYVTKPFRQEELLDKVKRALGAR